MKANQKELIDSIIKQNPKYNGHQHLLEHFRAEVYKKSYLLLDSVSNLDSLKNYLIKVADTSISNVIKNNPAPKKIEIINEPSTLSLDVGAVRTLDVNTVRAPEVDTIQIMPEQRKVQIKPIEIQSVAPKRVPEIKDQRKKVVSVQSARLDVELSDKEIKNIYDKLIDPIEFSPKKVTNSQVAADICELIAKLDKNEPDKKYAKIFKMRYVDNLRQSTIAKSLNLSQGDLSRRFCEIVKLLRQELA